MANEREFGSQRDASGRSGNDFLQRRGGGYESWGAEGPSGASAAGREWGRGAAGGYGRSRDYGREGETGRWGGANAGTTPDTEWRSGTVQRHWMRSSQAGGMSFGAMLAGVGLGAALMYFLDPVRGARRRNVFADKAMSYLRDAREVSRDKVMHTRNRAVGQVAEVRGRFRDEEVSDDQLIARVRAELGHHVERVRPIEIAVEGGAVTLRGTVSDDELPKVVAAVERVRGVQRIVNQLQVKPVSQNTPTNRF